MKKLELSSAFLIGHKQIDSEHAELVDILNEMRDGYLSKDSHVCRQKWQLYCEKLEQHFINERKIMQGLGFSDSGHGVLYREVLDKVRTVGENSNSLGEWKECLYALRSSLLSWVLKYDLKLAEYIVTIGYSDA